MGKSCSTCSVVPKKQSSDGLKSWGTAKVLGS